jgi:hypothetical protein
LWPHPVLDIKPPIFDRIEYSGFDTLSIFRRSVRITNTAAHERDALVYCGPKAPPDALEVPNPIIVVEDLSPSPRRIDESTKLKGYFSLPSVHHSPHRRPGKPPLFHHKQQDDGTILTRLVGEGALRLDPPGLEIEVAPLFESSPRAGREPTASRNVWRTGGLP